jgi:hypothetical protein
MEADDRAARRAARANWPVRRLRLGEEGDEGPESTWEERLVATWELSVQAWAVAGLPMPTYERSNAPTRLLRKTERDG